MTPSTALRFGRFELQTHERRLLADGQPVPLGARAFDLLLALAERAGRLVSKRVLMELVWPGLVVQDNNLAAQMSALRKVLGDAVIATIPGRGYRFVARIDGAASPSAIAPAPQTDATAALPTHLPTDRPALLGRGAELAALHALLDAHRVVTIVGPGGIGKSLLAQHLLHARRDRYPQGVCWVELGPVTDATALAGTIASALGVHGGPGDAMAQLSAALAPLTMLLALDNAEHLLADVAALCAALHRAAPGLHIVVTSQAPLQLVAERVCRIGPLAVPAQPLPAEQALQFGAVALFAERAHAADASFSLTDANATTAIALCRALDGLPLAIELAAARAPLLGLHALLSSMNDRLRLLTTTRNRAAPARQQTLRAALDWSHAFLGLREQRAFRRLAVVAGSASLAFIQQLASDAPDGVGAADASPLDAWGVLDALDQLVERSLVAVVSTDDATPRYRLLETPRAYALERLEAAGEHAALQRRHAQATAALLDAAYDRYFSGEVGIERWHHQLAPDFDNARDALAWARRAGDATAELGITATMLRALPPSLHAERMALADACEQRLAQAPVSTALQLRAWTELSCAWADTQKTRSRDAGARAVQLARDRGDRFALYHALCRWASACAQCGDVAAARPPLAEALALEDATWPAQRLLWGAEAAQVVARMRGDTADALQRSRRLVALDRERGGDASIALGNLIDHELAAGDAAAAARSGAALIAALQGTRHEYSLAFARINLCAACLALDDAVQARAVAEAAWPQAVVFDLPHVAAAYLALLAALEARPRAAAQLIGYCDRAYLQRGETRESNETAARSRAQQLATAALGGDAVRQEQARGATLREAEVAALAFARDDS